MMTMVTMMTMIKQYLCRLIEENESPNDEEEHDDENESHDDETEYFCICSKNI